MSGGPFILELTDGTTTLPVVIKQDWLAALPSYVRRSVAAAAAIAGIIGLVFSFFKELQARIESWMDRENAV